LPGVDQVVLRLMEGGADAGWAALQEGTCDALDASFRLAEYPEVLAEIGADGAYDVRVANGESWTQLVFGMRPAEYDTLANPVFAQRPDYFADPRVRQGIAHCLDRQSLAAQTHTEPWTSFLPPAQSIYQDGIPYDPVVGAALLEAVGWRDHDDDPATARLSQNVLSVFDGIPLTLTLLVGESPFHQDLAVSMVASLAACGVGLNVETLPLPELYAPGPEGLLFGRRFDLALIAWQPLPGPDCGLYHSWAIPDASNGWLGTNIAGFTDERYDAACSAAMLALPDEMGARLAEAEAAFLELLPAVPLVAPPAIEVWRK